FLSRLRGSRKGDAARFAAVLGLNRSIANAADRRSVLQLLLDEAVDLFRAERGFLIESLPDGEFAVTSARNLDREVVKNPGAKISTTVVRRCLESRDGVFVEDAQNDPDEGLSGSQSIADMQLRSVLCIPLLAADRCYGCLYLDHRFHSSVFGADDLPWVQALADQGAIALRMYELLHAEAERTAAAARGSEQLTDRLVEVETELQQRAAVDLDRGKLEHEYPRIVGHAPATVRFLQTLDRVAAVDLSVLLVGESGCGKELAARAIHEYSRRGDARFVPVNVAAVSPAVLESELFGHVRGAYTGAERDREGLVRHAAGGVLFLDEVTEMPLDMQVKLLRFLEDHVVRPVGSDATYDVDLRVVAATNRDPFEAIQEGVLREDLYYRLAALSITVPPLRERLTDMPVLVEAFLREAAVERGAPARAATPALVDALRRRAWPGNVRQLRNEVFRLDAMADGDEIDPTLVADGSVGHPVRQSLVLADLEQWAIGEALRATGGNKAEAARVLGISRRALYNKLARGES
ncbi:MAG: sigma-54-dependent Fis family transcriptional regulator, partial [Planctomycetes bacterium]|nr:sigma-54-dependent Fis family transcriptional regulator [Planctomycetota bacterium]